MIQNLARQSWGAPLLATAAACFLCITGSTRGELPNLTKVDINMPLDNDGNPIVGTVVDNQDGSFTVTAGGGDTWDNHDSFTFLYEEKSGNFDVQVQILNLEVDDARQQDSAKASIHVRSSLDDDAANVMINGTPESGANYVETIFRKGKGQGTDDPPVNAFFPNAGGPWDGTYRPAAGTHLYSPADGHSTWLRMRRAGNTIQTYASANGKSWVMVTDFTLDPSEFGSTLYLGLGAVAHIGGGENIDNRVRATFANYGNTPQAVPSVDGTNPVDASAGPGVYPNQKVTAANWKIVVPEDGKGPDDSFIVVNGNKKNEYILTLDGSGTPEWSAPGYNQGDLDISLSPRDPSAAQANLGPYSNPSRSLSVTDPASPVTQAWLPSTRHGLILATIRKNQQQWNDNGEGGATPPFSAFASVSVDFSSRKGFSMDSGTFENGEIYISFFKLGDVEPLLPQGASPFALREANIDLATAWFPFAQGWKAGYLANATKAPAAYWLKQGAHSGEVAEGTANLNKVSSRALFRWTDIDGQGTYGGLGRLTLPDVNSLTDGMLFTTSTDDQSDNEGQVVTASPIDDDLGAGWVIAMRQDDTNYDPASYSVAERSEFGFVYIPYTAGKLIGGYIRGADGVQLAGPSGFTIRRLAAGRYEVTIPGKTGTSGMLLLQNAGWLAVDPSMTDDAALSYEYQGGNAFIIESHAVEPGNGAGDKAVTRDTDFYFAWVDFQDPLTPTASIEPGIALQSSATVAGPYTDETAAVVDSTAKTLTLAQAGTSARFYRTSSATALKLKSVKVQGNSVVITYE